VCIAHDEAPNLYRTTESVINSNNNNQGLIIIPSTFRREMEGYYNDTDSSFNLSSGCVTNYNSEYTSTDFSVSKCFRFTFSIRTLNYCSHLEDKRFVLARRKGTGKAICHIKTA